MAGKLRGRFTGDRLVLIQIARIAAEVEGCGAHHILDRRRFNSQRIRRIRSAVIWLALRYDIPARTVAREFGYRDLGAVREKTGQGGEFEARLAAVVARRLY